MKDVTTDQFTENFNIFYFSKISALARHESVGLTYTLDYGSVSLDQIPITSAHRKKSSCRSVLEEGHRHTLQIHLKVEGFGVRLSL